LAAPSAHYPEFSWDKVPLYMHVRKSAAFTPEELEYLAQFPLITLEKTTASKTYGSTEKGTIESARQIKQINPRARGLYYRNVIVHYGNYAANESFGGIADPLLKDQRTGSTKLVRDRVEAYDLENPAVRKWWVGNARETCSNAAVDGLFLDGNVKALEEGYLKRNIGGSKKKATMDGYHTMMKETVAALGSEKLMLANILRARFPKAGLEYINYFDGSYVEGFEHAVGGMSREEYIAKGIDAIQQAARKGKIIAFCMGLGKAGESEMGIDETRAKAAAIDQARMEYCLALFLVCAEKYSYCHIHDGYHVDGKVESKTWGKSLPFYDKKLGEPKGPARKKGFVYTREFKHCSVWLDIENEVGKIKWK
jgi:hypothetical protein